MRASSAQWGFVRRSEVGVIVLAHLSDAGRRLQNVEYSTIGESINVLQIVRPLARVPLIRETCG
jgi:hypothetical protein